MPQNFIACERDQSFLMPPSLRDWLPADALAWCVLDAVAEMDLSAIYADYRADGHGRAAFDPAMMVALLLYAYAVGERSSRRIERCCQMDVAFRVICANQAPDHATIARFRVRHQDALAELFSQVLGLCERAGLVSLGVISLDSTKMLANASGLANRTYEQIAREILAEADAVDAVEDEQFGEARGDELPPELADPTSRRARLREAKRRLEAEQQAAQEAYQQKLQRRAERWAAGGTAGRKPTPPRPDRRATVNVTDPDSRPVRGPRGFIQGYNAQAVATERQIIIAAEVRSSGTDQGQLEPMIRAAARELGAAAVEQQIGVAVADAGYLNVEQIQNLWGDGVQALVPPDGQLDGKPTNPRIHHGICGHLRRVLSTEQGRALYKRRQRTIEPIFGHTKHNRKIDRFQRRGLAACRSEWRLIAATHNLLKLWTATTAPAIA